MNGHPVIVAASHGVALSPDVSVDHLLLQTAVWMAVIVGALFGLKWLATRSSARRQGPKQRSGRPRAGRFSGARTYGAGLTGGLEIIGRQPIGKGQWIAVVEAEGQRFLVGMSSSGFTALGELKSEPSLGEDPAASLDAILAAREARATAGGTRDRLGVPATPPALSDPSQKRSLVERAREATVRH